MGEEEPLLWSFQKNKGLILSAFGETDFPKKYRCVVYQGLLRYNIRSRTLKLQIKAHTFQSRGQVLPKPSG